MDVMEDGGSGSLIGHQGACLVEEMGKQHVLLGLAPSFERGAFELIPFWNC